MLTKLDPKYVAGLFDGEGSIHIRSKNEHNYRMQIDLTMTDRTLPDLLLQQYGGEVRPYKPKDKPHWKERYAWRLWSTEQFKKFLPDIEPYVVLKKERVQLALMFVETFEFSETRAPLEPEVVEVRKEIADLITLLNRKGVLIEEEEHAPVD